MDTILQVLLGLIARCLVKPIITANNLSVATRRKLMGALASFNISARVRSIEALTIHGVNVELVTPKKIINDKVAIIYLHGGCYFLCGPKTHRSITTHLANKSQAKLFAVQYALSPEAQFPQAANDVLNVYQYLLDQQYNPKNIMFAGDSAGGNLALSSLLQAQQKNMPMVAAVALFSPWVDMQNKDSAKVSDKHDKMLAWDLLDMSANQYAGGRDLSDPLLSPVNAQYKNFAPVLMHLGGQEIFHAQCLKLEEKMKTDGVDISVKVYENMWHVFQALSLLKDTQDSLDATSAFFKAHMLYK